MQTVILKNDGNLPILQVGDKASPYKPVFFNIYSGDSSGVVERTNEFTLY